MTKTQFKKKVKDLKRSMNKLVDDRVEKAIKSGAINFEDYEDDYVLPKIFIYAVADEIKFQFKPLYAEHLKEAKNLTYFL